MARISKPILLIAFAVMSYCSWASAQVAGPEQWQSALYQDHQLVGKIWSSREQRFIDEDTLWLQLTSASYLLLGEKHDNPDHHVLQLRVLEGLISDGSVSQITFEMLDSNSAAPLSSFLETEFESDTAMKEFLVWDDQGWNWSYYGPLLNAAHAAAVPVKAGNISVETVRAVSPAPTPPEIESIFEADTMARLNADIDESHCGMLPESQFPPMVRVQQTRDYSMAENLLVAEGMGVLIAGNYHVRHDLGVPNYLLARDEQLQRSEILSLAFLEVVQGENEPERYLDQFGAQAAYDYIWFTPAVSDEDYCDSLR